MALHMFLVFPKHSIGLYFTFNFMMIIFGEVDVMELHSLKVIDFVIFSCIFVSISFSNMSTEPT